MKVRFGHPSRCELCELLFERKTASYVCPACQEKRKALKVPLVNIQAIPFTANRDGQFSDRIDNRGMPKNLDWARDKKRRKRSWEPL